MAATRKFRKVKPGQAKLASNPIVRGFLVVFGTICLGLGIIGIPVPILPTTPFLLLAAFCYARGSKKAYRWLITNRYFGSYIKDYQRGRGIPLRVKVIAISTLWITILISAFLIIDIDKLWVHRMVQAILLIIATGVTIHLVSLPTAR